MGLLFVDEFYAFNSKNFCKLRYRGMKSFPEHVTATVIEDHSVTQTIAHTIKSCMQLSAL